jgi:AcrR family transcriptional regulator
MAMFTTTTTPLATDTRELLITSARRLFATGGYDGTSIRAITAEAGTNLGAVTYHFGSKRALYEAVLARVMEPLGERIADATRAEGSSLDRLAALVRVFFHQLRDNPDQPFLILQEIAAGKPPPRPVSKVMGMTAAAVVEVIERGQQEGVIRDGDPFLLFLSLVSQPVYMSLARHAFRAPGGPDWMGALDWDDAAVQESIVEHAVLFARQGLAAAPTRKGGRQP